VSDAFKDQGAGLEILGNENLSKTFSSPGGRGLVWKSWETKTFQKPFQVREAGAGLEILGNENLSKTFSSPGGKTILKTWNLSRSLSASNTLFQLGPYAVR